MGASQVDVAGPVLANTPVALITAGSMRVVTRVVVELIAATPQATRLPAALLSISSIPMTSYLDVTKLQIVSGPFGLDAVDTLDVIFPFALPVGWTVRFRINADDAAPVVPGTVRRVRTTLAAGVTGDQLIFTPSVGKQAQITSVVGYLLAQGAGVVDSPAVPCELQTSVPALVASTKFLQIRVNQTQGFGSSQMLDGMPIYLNVGQTLLVNVRAVTTHVLEFNVHALES
jgi:hypothetical protein